MKITQYEIKRIQKIRGYYWKLVSDIDLMTFYESARDYLGLRAIDLVEERDAKECELKYISRLLEKTPNLKRFIVTHKKKIADSELAKEYKGKLLELSEEAFYLWYHILAYEEKEDE